MTSFFVGQGKIVVGWGAEEGDNLTLGRSLLSGPFKFICKMFLFACLLLLELTQILCLKAF